jgi:hypothetical protein
MSTQLWNSLRKVYDATVEAAVVAHRAQWVANPNWGTAITDVRGFVVHETSGWPARANADGFNVHYWRGFDDQKVNPHPPPDKITVHHNADGFGSQYYISGDGTVFSLVPESTITFHSSVSNSVALSSETGHSQGHSSPAIPPPTNLWRPLNGVSNSNAAGYDDLLGVKMWWRSTSFDEMVVSWWTTARFAGPQRGAVREPEQLFTEQHYRSWALLARWAAEHFLIPRNFPLYPHKLADPEPDLLDDGDLFRKLLRADDGLSRRLTLFGWTQAQVDDDAHFQGTYHAGLAGGVNRHWRTFVQNYRGFYGHGFTGIDAHDCPGPLFDWHRMSREVWDWWWWPFDFNAARTSTNVTAREYSRSWNGDTPTSEYFFATPAASYAGRQVPGIHGNTGSPRTYRLDQGSRVYAAANGELVAARFPPVTNGVSLAFVLVRHEVFHQVHPRAGLDPAAGQERIAADRLNYDDPPSIVYSLYMHLARPDGMSFDAVADGNPDWLNRLLVRKKEVEVGIAFHRDHAAQVGNAAWNSQPPGDFTGLRSRRPTVLESWTTDEANYTPTLTRLRNGDLTLMPIDPWCTPIKILLGDYLGNAGVISRTSAGVQTFGIRVEIFSRDVISTDFTLSQSSAATGWNATGTAAGSGGHAVRYPSEWARTPAGAEQTSLQEAGVDVELANWWSSFALGTQMDLTHVDPLTAAMLPASGDVVHYDPPSFLAWLNGKTWRSEWSKYRVAGAVPAQPRSRG